MRELYEELEELMGALAVKVTWLGRWTQEDVENESGTKIQIEAETTRPRPVTSSQHRSRLDSTGDYFSRYRTYEVRISI